MLGLKEIQADGTAFIHYNAFKKSLLTLQSFAAHLYPLYLRLQEAAWMGCRAISFLKARRLTL